MDTVLEKLDKLVEADGLSPETEAIILGALMADEVWLDLLDRSLAA
ncbi:MAG: hypothetical protein ACREJN_16175 [Nitrospiraceae bacterium]